MRRQTCLWRKECLPTGKHQLQVFTLVFIYLRNSSTCASIWDMHRMAPPPPPQGVLHSRRYLEWKARQKKQSQKQLSERIDSDIDNMLEHLEPSAWVHLRLFLNTLKQRDPYHQDRGQWLSPHEASWWAQIRSCYGLEPLLDTQQQHQGQYGNGAAAYPQGITKQVQQLLDENYEWLCHLLLSQSERYTTYINQSEAFMGNYNIYDHYLSSSGGILSFFPSFTRIQCLPKKKNTHTSLPHSVTCH